MNQLSDHWPPHGEARDLLISVVVPVYNEEDVLDEFHRRLGAVLQALPYAVEVVYVNDGSVDGSLASLARLRGAHPEIAIVNLSRNFGKEIAMSAGIDHARGDAVVIIDADLQDPPEIIPEFIQHWLAGHDVVYGKRVSRDGETRTKKLTAFAFYRIMEHVANIRIPKDTGDFRLLSRRAVDALKQLREHHRFMKGLFTWIGYPQKEIPYARDPRHSGQTKWNYWKLWNFALEGITSFTISPLKLASYLGMLTALGAFIYAIIVVAKTLIWGDPVAGYPSLMVVILFLGGIQLITLGIMGEYLGRVFDESKNRPLYLVEAFAPSRAAPASGVAVDAVQGAQRAASAAPSRSPGSQQR
jgi:glycosyltransferase involved in cell wall biosynthesis